jgi:hypothetical protein
VDLSNVVGGATYIWGLKEGAWRIHPDYWNQLKDYAQKMFVEGRCEFRSPFLVYWTNQVFRITEISKYPLDRNVLVPRLDVDILLDIP